MENFFQTIEKHPEVSLGIALFIIYILLIIKNRE